MLQSNPGRTQAERKRILEIVMIVVTTLMLIGLSRLEARLFELSETLAQNQDFITTVVNFGLINFNVILILVLSFLLFRNVARLVVERRRGILGSRLRAKLVATLVFFALAPTILFFYISSRFIVTSFDEWFSEKVRSSMQQTQEAGAQVYRQDQRRLESLARFALQRINLLFPEGPYLTPELMFDAKAIEGFDAEYGLDNLKIYDVRGRLVWSSLGPAAGADAIADPFVVESLSRFQKEPGMYAKSTVIGEEQQDVVKGIAPIVHPATGDLLGAVMAENRFETQILKSIKSIQETFANLRPGAQLIKLSYLIILVVMSLLIIFSAVWLGFYVARGITRPIQNLAEASREVALGNYGVTLTPKTDDEAGQLVRAFNLMTRDLRRHRAEADDIRGALEKSNEELEQRRRYMEVVLKNISAGVISVDADGYVTSVNNAAAKILRVPAIDVTGRRITAFPKEIVDQFWRPVEEKLASGMPFTGNLDLSTHGRDITLIVDATKIQDDTDAGDDLGFVVVFDDATEELKAQRVAAWREVARRIAHEIKNPITPIKLSAQRLARRYEERFDGEDKQIFQTCVETIMKQVDSLRDLVNEFSKFARLPEIKPRPADINEVISETVESYKVSYPHIHFDTASLQPVPRFPLDRDQMSRVFINIVSNAVAALDQEGKGSGRIEFRSMVLPRLNTIRVEVIDNGPGIPERLLDRVMEPYFSTKPEGTGLGLAIVNQIISDHGGYLRIGVSEPKGTKIVIELPLGATGVA